jgi:hypothetical protein
MFMNRARISFAATLAVLALGAGVSAGQAAQAPPMKSVLAGKKLTPPARGEVIVEYTNPVRKRVNDMIITTFQVRNTGVAPIARLTITQTWFDKNSNVVGAGKKSIDGLLQPGDVQVIAIESVAKPDFNGDSFNFTHANGTVKPKQVAKLTVAATTTAKPATGTATTTAPPPKR